jgi:hypothetical protein
MAHGRRESSLCQLRVRYGGWAMVELETIESENVEDGKWKTKNVEVKK